MTEAQPRSASAELAEALTAKRRRSGRSQREVGELAGVTQAKLSRAEGRKGHLTVDEVRRLLEVLDVVGGERVRLLSLATEVQEEFVPSRVILQQGAHRFQQRIGELEATSTEVRSFAPTAVLGLLQTRAYATVVFGQRLDSAEAARSVEGRLARAQALDDPDRTWTLVQTQGALEWAIGGPDVMVEQIEHIAEVSRRRNVRLGIIPPRTSSSVLPLHGFHLYHLQTGWQASYGTREGTALIFEQERVGTYQALFDTLASLAVYDNEAHAVLGRVAADYRAD